MGSFPACLRVQTESTAPECGHEWPLCLPGTALFILNQPVQEETASCSAHEAGGRWGQCTSGAPDRCSEPWWDVLNKRCVCSLRWYSDEGLVCAGLAWGGRRTQGSSAPDTCDLGSRRGLRGTTFLQDVHLSNFQAIVKEWRFQLHRVKQCSHPGVVLSGDSVGAGNVLGCARTPGLCRDPWAALTPLGCRCHTCRVGNQDQSVAWADIRAWQMLERADRRGRAGCAWCSVGVRSRVCCVAEHSPVGLVVSVFICVEVYSEAFPASQKLKCCKQTLEPGLKTKQGSVGTVGAGGSWQLLGQLVRSRESPACPLQGSPCLSSCPRPIIGYVCLVLHSEPAKNLLCVVKQHECALPAPIRECWGQRRPG